MFRLAGSSLERGWWCPLQVGRLLRRPDDDSVRRLRDLGRPVHPGGATVRVTELLRYAGGVEGRREYTGEWEAIQKGASRGSVIEVGGILLCGSPYRPVCRLMIRKFQSKSRGSIPPHIFKHS